MSNCLARPDALLKFMEEIAAPGRLQLLAGSEGPRNVYVALPSLRKPRWLLPAKGPAGTKGMDIYTPYSLRAKLWKWLAGLQLRAGFRLGSGQCIGLDDRLAALDRLVSDITGERQPKYAICIGSGKYAKLTVQVMRESGEVLGFFKLPLTEGAVERVRNEAAMLDTIARARSLKGSVPELLYAGEVEGVWMLFQTRTPGRVGPHRMGAAHSELLRRLAELEPHQEKTGDSLVAEVRAGCGTKFDEAGKWKATMAAALESAQRLLQGEKIACGWIHGDFAPWNTRIDDGRLLVFDWESASAGCPADWDEFHFQVQVACLLGGPTHDLPLTTAAAPSKAGLFLLYLIRSAADLIQEGVPSEHPAIQKRKSWIEQLTAVGNRGLHNPGKVEF